MFFQERIGDEVRDQNTIVVFITIAIDIAMAENQAPEMLFERPA
jgi:hypothetical protein